MKPVIWNFFALFSSVVLFCISCGWVSAQNFSGLKEPAPVTLTSDQIQFNEETGTYTAQGDARLEKADFTLFSEKMEWNPEKNDVSATGKVLMLDKAGNFLSGDQFDGDFDTGKGTLLDGRGFWKESNFHVKGSRIEKLDEKRYQVRDAEFTSCDAQIPAWKFTAKNLEITRGGYAKAKHSLFYLRDIPVFYFPYYAYPVENRKSGLLMPSYGSSSRRGLQISQPYYWAISRNTDATFYIDYLSKLGLGKGVEYRYIWSERNAGEFHFYHISGWEEGEDRFALSWDHFGLLPGDVKLVADVEYVDEKGFFSDFGEEAEDYNKDTLISTIYSQKNWGKLNLSGQLKYIKDLDVSNDQTLQRLPEVRFSLIRKKFGKTPFFYGFDTSANYFWQEEGNTGERLTLRPYLAAILKPCRFLDLDAEIGFLEKIYWTSEADANQELFDFTVGASTRMSRVFSVDGQRVKKIRHSFEPELRYTYLPEINQDEIFEFDRLDDIEPVNGVSLSLINRLTARLETPDKDVLYHEFLYFRLAQEYDIRESRRDRDANDPPIRPFSPIRSELIIRPTTWSFIDLDASYDFDSASDRLLFFRGKGGIRDQRGNALTVGYSYLEDEAEYLSGSLRLALSDPLSVSYGYRYDFIENRSLENVVRVEYRFQCWSVNLLFRDRPDDQEILFAFALKGIGNIFNYGFSQKGS